MRLRDRLAAARRSELSVDGDRLCLDRVAGDIQLLRDLSERKVAREERKETQLGRGQPRRGRAGDLGKLVDLALQSRSLDRQRAELGAALADVLDLRQQLVCELRVPKGEQRSRQLEPGLDREPRNSICDRGEELPR